MVEIGQTVTIPDQLTGDALNLCSGLGDTRVNTEVVSKTGLGVCQLLLPNGVSLRHVSQLVPTGRYAGRHFIDVHEKYIK